MKASIFSKSSAWPTKSSKAVAVPTWAEIQGMVIRANSNIPDSEQSEEFALVIA